MPVILFSNNPHMRAFLPPGSVRSEARPEETAASYFPVICRLFSGSASEVVTAARDKVHMGWVLLNHPLYGNFRPHQQPYRSLLLRGAEKPDKNKNGIGSMVVDAMSLHLLEEALEIYRSVPVLDPVQAPSALARACAVLDCELMRLPLLQAGLTEDRLGPRA